MIKTFRGTAADGDIVKINLATRQGLIGYQVRKFDGISLSPGKNDQETILQLFTVEPSSAVDTVNFADPTLLGVCYFKDFATNDYAPSDHTIIFDATKFNQDIFLTCSDARSTKGANYYIELEQVKLSQDEATVATLKDMRGRE